MTRSLYFCFTLNNYTDDDELYLQSLAETNDVTYLLYGKENAPTTGTPHLQGYIEFARRMRLAQASRLLPRCRLAARNGTALQAADYCKGEGDFIEIGEISNPEPGKRSDLDDLYETISSGASLAQISDEHFGSFLRYERGIRSYNLLHSIPRTWECDVRVYWGDTGMGKTRAVYDEFPLSEIYQHPEGSWFDGYEGHRVVLFDDYSGSCMRLPYLLKIIDRYPMRVPVKGGFVNWCPRVIIFTSNLNPATAWYPNAHPEHVRAMLRRIQTIRSFLRNVYIPEENRIVDLIE